MRRILSLPTACLLLLAVSAARADLLTEPFYARYKVEADGLNIGEMVRTQQRLADGTYRFRSELYTTGLAALFKPDHLTQTSIWKDRNGRLVPVEFRSEQTGHGGKRDERVVFDWKRGIARSEYRDKRVTLPLTSNTFDKQVYQVVMRRDLATGDRKLTYRVAEKQRVRDYDFRVVGEEKLRTPIGNLQTVRVEKPSMVMWYAKKLDYLLVKITKKEHGRELSSTIVATQP